jgi:hypothetical protein
LLTHEASAGATIKTVTVLGFCGPRFSEALLNADEAIRWIGYAGGDAAISKAPQNLSAVAVFYANAHPQTISFSIPSCNIFLDAAPPWYYLDGMASKDDEFMDNIGTAVVALLTVAGLVFLAVIFGAVGGAFCGWVVGWFFGDTILAIARQLGLHDITMWQFGAFLGFVGGFFRAIVGKQK